MSRVEEPHAGIVMQMRDHIRRQLPASYSSSRLELWQQGFSEDAIEWLIGDLRREHD